jgi:hypothetical protein
MTTAKLCSLLCLAFCLAGPPRGQAEEEQTPADDDSRESIVRAAQGYQLFLGADRQPLKMEPEPVLRWPNATRGTPDGATFVWTLDGRPEAIACIWQHGVLSNAFHSLSGSKLIAQYGGQTVWHPEKPGISFTEFEKAPEPAESAVKRLSQMKELARRFSCRLVGDENDELRLMPRPLYRYKTDRPELYDGGLFAFVQGTDPEVVLVLEAQRRDGKSAWKYALTRRSMLGLEAKLDGKPIWSVPKGIGDRDQPWYHGWVQ